MFVRSLKIYGKTGLEMSKVNGHPVVLITTIDAL